MKKEKYEPVEGQKFARKCDITGEGMDAGWVIENPFTRDNGKYVEHIKYEKDALMIAKEMGFESIKDAFENEEDEDAIYNGGSTAIMYWTDYTGQGDDLYIIKNGILVEI